MDFSVIHFLPNRDVTVIGFSLKCKKPARLTFCQKCHIGLGTVWMYILGLGNNSPSKTCVRFLTHSNSIQVSVICYDNKDPHLDLNR